MKRYSRKDKCKLGRILSALLVVIAAGCDRSPTQPSEQQFDLSAE
jgi:hypothetical protein